MGCTVVAGLFTPFFLPKPNLAAWSVVMDDVGAAMSVRAHGGVTCVVMRVSMGADPTDACREVLEKYAKAANV